MSVVVGLLQPPPSKTGLGNSGFVTWSDKWAGSDDCAKEPQSWLIERTIEFGSDMVDTDELLFLFVWKF